MKPMSRTTLLLAAALAAGLLAAPAAQAFTYESASGVTANGGSNLVDPDAQFDSMSKGNSTMSLPGGATVQFGNPNSQSNFNNDYQSEMNHLFNPAGSPGN
jgi:hypothetical protein